MDKTAYFEQMRKKRKNDILDAAREMLLKDGIDSFNIQQLARDLDISTVTLYKYFKNSEDIMAALLEQILESQQFLPVSFLPVDNPLTAFLDFHRTFYQNILEDRENVTLLALFEVYLHNKPQYEQFHPFRFPYFEQTSEFLIGLLEDAKAMELISSSVQPEEAFEFIATLNIAMIRQIGLIKDDTFEQQKETVKRQISQLLDLIVLYLKS